MKKIFLTGASSGIGRAIAERLSAEGHEVWGTSRDPKKIPVLPRLYPVCLDLCDMVLARKAFGEALADAGNFDVMINNAGTGHFDPAATLSTGLVAWQFQTLVQAQIELTQLALAAMNQRGVGLIINISSLAARLPVPFMSSYNAAKAAFASYTMTLQVELRGCGIRVTDLQPADIRTSFNHALSKSNSDDHVLGRTWAIVERNMRDAPGPELVARRVSGLILEKNPPPRVTVGGFFQASVAPLIFRFLPQRARVWSLKKYYGL